MMPARLAGLEQALEGFRETGVLLVARAGANLQAAGFSDDLGLYLLVPPLAHWLGQPVEGLTRAVLGGATVAALALAGAGAWLLLRAWPHRLAALLALLWYARFLVHGLGGWNGDVYMFYSVTPLATLPLYLWISRQGRFGALLAGAVLVGLGAGLSHVLRAHSGWPVLLLALVMTWGAAHARARKVLVSAALIAATALPLLAAQVVVAQRDAYLARHAPDGGADRAGHPFWHTVYIGLGYLPNPYGIAYRDEVAMAKVQATDPGAPYLSARYEAVLRAAVREIAAADPGFIVRTVFAKAAQVLYLILNLHHVLVLGLLACAWRLRRHGRPLWERPEPLAVGLLVAAGMYGVFGLVAVPRADYVNGVFACVWLYLLLLLTRLRAAVESRAA